MRRRRHAMADKPLSYDVVAIIDYVKSSKTKTFTPAETLDTLNDIHTHLCRLLSSMLNSPLTGRMFIPMHDPQAQCVEKMASLKRQLLDS